MVADNPNTAFLLRRNLVSLNRRENVIRLFLERALQKRNAMLRVKLLIGCQVVRDCNRGFAKHIRHDGIKRHIADGKGVLETVLFTAFHTGEFVTVTGQFPQNTDIPGWDKAAFHQTDTEQIPDPLGVLGVILISFHSLDPFRVGDDDTDTLFFQNVEYGNPILPGRFHAHIQAIVFTEPAGKAFQIRVKCRKTLFLITWLYTVLWRLNNGSNHKGLVNIHSTAGWKYSLQKSTPSFENRRKQ